MHVVSVNVGQPRPVPWRGRVTRPALDQGMVKRFRDSGRPGIYFAVAAEGDVAAGDAIELVRRAEAGPTVADLFGLILDDKDDVVRLRQALRVPALAAVLREEFTERLA